MMQGIQSALRSYQVEGKIDWKKLFELYQYGEMVEQPSLSAAEKEIIEKMPRLERKDQEIVKKSEEMFGKDLEKMEKAWEMRKSPKSEYRYYPIDEEIIQFMDQAFAVYWERKTGTKRR